MIGDWLSRAREDFFDDVARVGDLVEADECIDFGHLACEFLGKTLRHAAAHDQLLAGFFAQAALLVRVEDCVDGFLLRGVDERAGVDDEHVGLVGVGRDFHSVFQNAAEHDLGIDEVLRAAERDDADLGGFLRG